MVLGLAVTFKQRDYTNEEQIDLLRRMYAYGGLFAAEAGSYANFLFIDIDAGYKPSMTSNISSELAFFERNNLEIQTQLHNWFEQNAQLSCRS